MSSKCFGSESFSVAFCRSPSGIGFDHLGRHRLGPALFYFSHMSHLPCSSPSPCLLLLLLMLNPCYVQIISHTRPHLNCSNHRSNAKSWVERSTTAKTPQPLHMSIRMSWMDRSPLSTVVRFDRYCFCFSAVPGRTVGQWICSPPARVRPGD